GLPQLGGLLVYPGDVAKYLFQLEVKVCPEKAGFGRNLLGSGPVDLSLGHLCEDLEHVVGPGNAFVTGGPLLVENPVTGVNREIGHAIDTRLVAAVGSFVRISAGYIAEYPVHGGGVPRVETNGAPIERAVGAD